MQKLPKYYVIKRDPSNPLWEKFLEWFKKESTFSFPNGTLEQWDEAVNGFVLPEKWYIKLTDDNRAKIFAWAGYNKPEAKYMSWLAGWFDDTYNYDNYTEITFAQFKKHVLKENDMSKEEKVKVGDWVWSNTPNVAKEKLGGEKGFYGILTRISTYGFDDYYIKTNDHNCSIWCNTCRKATKEEIENFTKTEPMKDRTITAQQAQSIIDVACCTWKENLAVSWGGRICQKKNIVISERFYQEMRSACLPKQHELFDSIFGKDKKEFKTNDLKAGEWLEAEDKHYFRTPSTIICLEDSISYDKALSISGKKVKITNIEFTEVND